MFSFDFLPSDFSLFNKASENTLIGIFMKLLCSYSVLSPPPPLYPRFIYLFISEFQNVVVL